MAINLAVVFQIAVALGRPYDLVHKVWQAAESRHLNPYLVVALVEHESRFNPRAVGRNTNGTTDHGLFQLNAGVWGEAVSRFSVDENIAFGCDFLAQLLLRYRVQGALSAYNTGGDTAHGRRYAAHILKRMGALEEIGRAARGSVPWEGGIRQDKRNPKTNGGRVLLPNRGRVPPGPLPYPPPDRGNSNSEAVVPRIFRDPYRRKDVS